jgi:hypothetical protein
VRGPRRGSPAGVLDSPASSNTFTPVGLNLSNSYKVAFPEGGRDARGPSIYLIVFTGSGGLDRHKWNFMAGWREI